MKLKKVKTSRIMLLGSILIVSLFILTLSISYSAFLNRSESNVANIKVAGMQYSISINGLSENKMIIPNNKITTANIVISALNNSSSKYELIFKVCETSECTSYIEKPSSLKVEYSSKTIDNISGEITKNGTKQIRIAVTNTSSKAYYIELGINAGYTHNTLTLQKLIDSQYNEEDVTIAATINGDISTTFPTNKNYIANVKCLKNGAATNASGTATWSGSSWIVNITGVNTGQVICNVDFIDDNLTNRILEQGGGKKYITSRGPVDRYSGTSDVYMLPDDYGNSYYYYGDKSMLKNNILFGGFQWKIIRINGDGSIRLIYNGTEDMFNLNEIFNASGSYTTIDEVVWNLNYQNDAKYVGYMYGGENGVASTSYEEATKNSTDSNIKKIIDNWYEQNLHGTDYEKQIADSVFCNGRSTRHNSGGYGSEYTIFNKYYEVYWYRSYYYSCSQVSDRFTSKDISYGNGALKYPVGTITINEAAIAGLDYTAAYSNNYLYNGINYWTMTPATFENNIAYMSIVDYSGTLINNRANQRNYVRPVISIKGDVTVTGTGTDTDPFRVV